jgi:pimeloyl-ACP methyl ester carboxylesterase
MRTKIKLDLPHGLVTGQYLKSSDESSPLIIITNGSNGFYNYGMFPKIQETLYENGISSFSYNFSHGGVEDDSDYFSQLDLYEKNCMRLEVEDLYGIVKSLSNEPFHFNSTQKLYLMAHSLGGIPTIFAAKKLNDENIKVNGIILLASVSKLGYSKEIMDNWEKEGVWLMKNNRTNQMLPRGKEFLTEVKNSDTTWNVSNAMKKIQTKYLIIYGEKDESVNPENSKVLSEWAKDNNQSVTDIVIKNATHTFNTKHPFEGGSPELKEMLSSVVNWINKNK